MNRLSREGTAAPASVQERAQRLGRRLRLREIPAVMLHSHMCQPCLCGAFRPITLLPKRWFATVGDRSLDAVLAHELAHARWLDHLVNLAQRLLEVVFFFHPCVHWLSRSLPRQRKYCADELAIRLTGDPLALATALECVARFRVALPRRSRWARRGGETVSLLPRIQELIGMMPVPSRPQTWPYVAVPLAAVFALVTISAGSAQDRPSASQSISPSFSRDAAPVKPHATAPASVPLPATAPAGADPKRQYSYVVRQLDLEEGSWRDRLDGQLKPLGADAKTQGWIIDGDAPRCC